MFSAGVVARDCRTGALVVAGSRCLLLLDLRCGWRLDAPFFTEDLSVPRLAVVRVFDDREDVKSSDGSLFLSPPVYTARFDLRFAFS